MTEYVATGFNIETSLLVMHLLRALTYFVFRNSHRVLLPKNTGSGSMIQNVAFQRKVLYLGIMALLMIPLYMIGHPAAGDPMSNKSLPGGKLAKLRTLHDLSQAQLGEIDPASESMKLATLGLRGVAANILWTKANEYKKKRELGEDDCRGQPNGQTAAQLRYRLGVSVAQSLVQHLRRTRRLPFSLSVGQEGQLNT